jgi:hypothetical protein
VGIEPDLSRFEIEEYRQMRLFRMVGRPIGNYPETLLWEVSPGWRRATFAS